MLGSRAACSACSSPSSSSSSIAFASFLVAPLSAGVQRAERFALIRLPPRLDLLPEGFRLISSPAARRNCLLYLPCAFLGAEAHRLLVHPRPFSTPLPTTNVLGTGPTAPSGILLRAWLDQASIPSLRSYLLTSTEAAAASGRALHPSPPHPMPPRHALAAASPSVHASCSAPGELPCQEPLVGISWLGQPL